MGVESDMFVWSLNTWAHLNSLTNSSIKSLRLLFYNQFSWFAFYVTSAGHYTATGITSTWRTWRCPPAHEGEPLQHEVAGFLHTLSVRAPVFQTKISEIFEDVQSFTGGDVPVSALLYLSKDPGLDESTPRDIIAEPQHEIQIHK